MPGPAPTFPLRGGRDRKEETGVMSAVGLVGHLLLHSYLRHSLLASRPLPPHTHIRTKVTSVLHALEGCALPARVLRYTALYDAYDE